MSALDDIAKLDKLRRDGVITQAEFEAQKARLLIPAAAPAAISGPATAPRPGSFSASSASSDH